MTLTLLETGSIQVDPGPDIDKNYIQNFLVKDVECYNDNTGSIVLRRYIVSRFLKCNQEYKTGNSSNFRDCFAGVATYTDILRVTINGTDIYW